MYRILTLVVILAAIQPKPAAAQVAAEQASRPPGSSPRTMEPLTVGESLAGLFVVETLLTEPDLFDTYIAIDPSLWWNDGKLTAAAADRVKHAAGRSIFLASSDQPEIAESTRRLADTLAAHEPPEVRWYYEAMPEETHATIYHPAALRAFRKLFGPRP